jgi:hypothetical protein
MGKILQFKLASKETRELQGIRVLIEDVDDDISAIVNDFSLTPANRRWLLENMLMDIDDRLEHYKQEFTQAERKLEQMVRSSEREIEAAYHEYIACVKHLTRSAENVARKEAKRRR